MLVAGTSFVLVSEYPLPFLPEVVLEITWSISGFPFIIALLRSVKVSMGVSQVLFAVVPLRVTAAATLRAAPRWGRYAAVVAGIACNVAVQALITLALTLPTRGDGFIWRMAWRRVALAWVMLGAHTALTVAVFRLKQRFVACRTIAGSTQVSRCN